MSYQEILYRNYSSKRGCGGGEDKDYIQKYQFFKDYLELNYLSVFKDLNKNPRILEIGCNFGATAKAIMEIFPMQGGATYIGIDMCEDAINIAKSHNSFNGEFLYADAFEFLSDRSQKFDIILSRATFEHIKKEQIIELFKLIYNSLNDNGIVLIEVPNMDWLWSSHERYMDFTHECGFTKESLSQIMLTVFDEVRIKYMVQPMNLNLFKKLIHILAKNLLWCLVHGSILDTPSKEVIFSRNMLAIAPKCKKEEANKKVV